MPVSACWGWQNTKNGQNHRVKCSWNQSCTGSPSVCYIQGNSWDLLLTTLLKTFFFFHLTVCLVCMPCPAKWRAESWDLSLFHSLATGRLFTAALSESFCHKLVQKAYAVCKTCSKKIKSSPKETYSCKSPFRDNETKTHRSESKCWDPQNNWQG